MASNIGSVEDGSDAGVAEFTDCWENATSRLEQIVVATKGTTALVDCNTSQKEQAQSTLR